MSSIETIFSAWPSAQALADDIGVPSVTVRQWRNRSGFIPAKYWARVQAAALRRGHVLPLKLFLPPNVEIRSADLATDATPQSASAQG